MKPRTVLSMEQALSMSYATLRFAQLGWRVIRLEAHTDLRTTPDDIGLPGDPNRYIGEIVVDDDRRSYFIAPNVGKEAIALNLKLPEGRDLLRTLIRKLDVDIFCCNTLPSRYQPLGIDYETLKSVKPDIIWAGISAMGPDYPNTPGYDPALQAMAGYMEVTGFPDGPPTLAGIPIIDLKAGDEVYANVCLALAERAETGSGKAIHVSMLQAAASWLITTLPLLDFDCHPSEVTRCGNEHRKFIPVNTYPTADGFIFIAIGNDVQWKRLVELKDFSSLDKDIRKTNAGRHTERAAIHRELAEITATLLTSELKHLLSDAKIPHAPIHSIQQVRDMDAIASKLMSTRTPSGKKIHLPPPAVDIEEAVIRRGELSFAPRYNEHTESILFESGFTTELIDGFTSRGVIPLTVR